VAFIALQASVSFAQTAPADSARRGDLLDKLQRADESQFEADITGFDAAFRDSVLAALDSLGLEQFRKQSPKRQWRLGLSFDLATRLWDYNRTEGLVFGGGVTLEPLGLDGPWLQLQAAYASGSERVRHYEGVSIPLAPNRYLTAQVHYEDRVVPYGSNRPKGNSLRGLVGAEDAQDYLRRRGGGAYLGSRPHRFVRLSAGYEANKQSSAPVTTSFAMIGNLPTENLPVDEGIERAVVVGLQVGELRRELWEATVTHRVSGGALGGDFTYNRTDLDFATRRYLGRQEFVLEGGWMRTGGSVPVQSTADLGGVEMVRGFDRRSQVGTSAFRARFEYLVPYDVLRAAKIPLLRRARLQLVPWADAGRTWGGETEVWIQSAGLGVQYFLGPFGDASYLRLDTSFPMGPDRPQDLRVELRFTAGLF
jgi:hypothetical protein